MIRLLYSAIIKNNFVLVQQIYQRLRFKYVR